MEATQSFIREVPEVLAFTDFMNFSRSLGVYIVKCILMSSLAGKFGDSQKRG